MREMIRSVWGPNDRCGKAIRITRLLSLSSFSSRPCRPREPVDRLHADRRNAAFDQPTTQPSRRAANLETEPAPHPTAGEPSSHRTLPVYEFGCRSHLDQAGGTHTLRE